MSELKNTLLVKGRDVCAWSGISRDQLNRMVAMGTLKPVHLTGRAGMRMYRRDEVLKVFDK
jgi:hypothetical protein